MRIPNFAVLLIGISSCLLMEYTLAFEKSFNVFQSHRQRSLTTTGSRLYTISVPVSELEKDLTPGERSITSVVRKCGPAVAFVTTVMPSRQVNTTNRNRRRRQAAPNNKNQEKNSLPEGMGLGSGSGFQVAPGYLCTNFHVVERAFVFQTNAQQVKNLVDHLANNATNFLPSELINASKAAVLDKLSPIFDRLPEVYVRINSATKYQKCRIVAVEPDIDLAVLKVEPGDGDDTTNDTDSQETIAFGSSSALLVGQTVVAIGNPFGLDKTVTTGVVSAVNREFRAGTARTPANRPIRNCIQTDAAINPGNSGGPLLNLKGEVVGINTAIITTSGSNAGIGFAVPADQLKGVVDRIIREDRIRSGDRPDQGWLGVSVLMRRGSNSTLFDKNWVIDVEPGSPAAEAGIRPVRIENGSRLELGDAIVNVGGNDVKTYDELQAQLVTRVRGEQLALTLEDENGQRRVVYVKLGTKP